MFIYTENDTQNPIYALQITIYNTKTHQQYTSTCPNIQHVRKSIFQQNNQRFMLNFMALFIICIICIRYTSDIATYRAINTVAINIKTSIWHRLVKPCAVLSRCALCYQAVLVRFIFVRRSVSSHKLFASLSSATT